MEEVEGFLWKTNIRVAIQNCLGLVIRGFLLGLVLFPRQSVSIPWPWVSLKSSCQVRHGSLFLKEAQGQMGKLSKFVHSLAIVFFCLVRKG